MDTADISSDAMRACASSMKPAQSTISRHLGRRPISRLLTFSPVIRFSPGVALFAFVSSRSIHGLRITAAKRQGLARSASDTRSAWNCVDRAWDARSYLYCCRRFCHISSSSQCILRACRYAFAASVLVFLVPRSARSARSAADRSTKVMSALSASRRIRKLHLTSKQGGFPSLWSSSGSKHGSKSGHRSIRQCRHSSRTPSSIMQRVDPRRISG